MNRRTLLIISAVVLIFTVVGGVYWFLSKKTVPIVSVPTPTFPGSSGGISSSGGGVSGGGAPSMNNGFKPGSGAPLPRLYELHNLPVAGVGFYETGKGKTLAVRTRYMEKGLGNIFETPVDTFVESRISNETHPQVAEAIWGNNGNSVIFRFLDNKNDGLIKTHLLNLTIGATSLPVGTTTPDQQNSFLKTEEIFLPDYISFASAAADMSDNFFFLKETGGPVVGYNTDFKDRKESEIFNSEFTEWLPQYPSKNLITLNTKPSANVPGYLFFLNPKTKAVSRVLGEVNGLTTSTNSDGSFVLYSETVNKVPQVSLFDVTKNTKYPLPIQTIADKCVWSLKDKNTAFCAVPQSLPQADYPDKWYQGVFGFIDSLWQVNSLTHTATKIMDPGTYGAPGLDMTNLTLSSDDSYLLFINKDTGNPWVYRLTEIAPNPTTNTTTTTPTTTPTPTVLPSVIPSDMQKIK